MFNTENTKVKHTTLQLFIEIIKTEKYLQQQLK
jgi:hypothetical protein